LQKSIQLGGIRLREYGPAAAAGVMRIMKLFKEWQSRLGGDPTFELERENLNVCSIF
jgi:hypothetical protein